MLAVDRGNYVTSSPYQDAPQRIGYNITIRSALEILAVSQIQYSLLLTMTLHYSAPHMHGHALELLKDHLKPGCR